MKARPAQSFTDVIHWAIKEVELRTEAVVTADGKKPVCDEKFDLFEVDFLACEHHVATPVDEQRLRTDQLRLCVDLGRTIYQ